MSYIDKQKLLLAIANEGAEKVILMEDYGSRYVQIKYAAKYLRQIIDAFEVEAEPVQHGKWIYDGDVYDEYSHHCSLCGNAPLTEYGTMHEYKLTEYCPFCGARMDASKPAKDERIQNNNDLDEAQMTVYDFTKE